MIRLTSVQRAAIEAGRPVAIVDPLTHDDYVLIRAEEYERLAGERPAMTHEPSPDIAPMVLRSMQAFWRDLPGLLQKRRNRKKWAAYHGDERVIIARSEVDAYQECFRRGLVRGEFYVGWLREEPEEVPPWGTFESDRSLYEFGDEFPADDS